MTCNKQASLSTRELQQKIDLFWSQTEKKKKSFLVSKCLKKNRNFKKKKAVRFLDSRTVKETTEKVTK